MQDVSLAALLPLGFWYAGGGWQGLFVAAVPVGLGGIWRFNHTYPVLVDIPAMVCALLAACLTMNGLWWAAIPVVLVAGMVKETSPVFAAAFAWNPILLVGLLAPAVRHLQRDGEDVLDAENAWILAHPFRAARKYHRHDQFGSYVIPWGVAIIGLAALDVQLGAVLCLAYAQLLVATDTTRLYQWAWPTLAVAAAGVVPAVWLLPLAVVHLGYGYPPKVATT
jgi:hypothetical protein